MSETITINYCTCTILYFNSSNPSHNQTYHQIHYNYDISNPGKSIAHHKILNFHLVHEHRYDLGTRLEAMLKLLIVELLRRVLIHQVYREILEYFWTCERTNETSWTHVENHIHWSTLVFKLLCGRGVSWDVMHSASMIVEMNWR